MASMSRTKTISKKVRARKTTKRFKIKRFIPKPKFEHSDLEELLIQRISLSNAKERGNAQIIPEILYNISSSTKRLGYNCGFTAGAKLSALHNHSNTIAPLI